MADAVYYDKPVLLDRERHKRLRVRASNGYAFARLANSVYLARVQWLEQVALPLFRTGELHLVAMHLASLSNMQMLIDRMARRGPAPIRAAPKPA